MTALSSMMRTLYFTAVQYLFIILLSASNLLDALPQQHNRLPHDFTYVGFSNALMASF